MLDPAQNHAFRDHYLEINIDLSRVLFIATSNQLGTIHPALLDRMEIISLTGYSEEEKVHIARRYLIPRQLEEHGLTPDQVTIEDDGAAADDRAVHARGGRARASSGRSAPSARKIAARVASGDRGRRTAAATSSRQRPCRNISGRRRFTTKCRFRVSRPGVATGVAWTETGGDVLFIEASLLPAGHGNVTLTGQLGNVMQESARAAVSHIRSSAKALGVAGGFLEHARPAHSRAGRGDSERRSVGRRHDGDGDRVGARNQPVREDVAMTGEITLSGLVLPVGGIREKALAARRHGIKVFVLPERNEPDLAELPSEVKADMKFVPVETLEEALKSRAAGTSTCVTTQEP